MPSRASGRAAAGPALPAASIQPLEAYAAHYAAAQRKRRVKWLPYLGTVDVEVEMNDGRRVRASVTPVEAAVAELDDVVGADAILELGPGHALATMARDALPEARVHALADFRSADGVRDWIAASQHA